MTINTKRRLLYLLLTTCTMILGLASRRFSDHLPSFIASYSGDTLWAMMIFWGLGFLFPQSTSRIKFFSAILFCYAIEISQLYQADWINAIRQTTLGGLIFGYGFLWSDLLCYTVGIVLCVLLDHFFIRNCKYLKNRSEWRIT